jgi:hypothetical protein
VTGRLSIRDRIRDATPMRERRRVANTRLNIRRATAGVRTLPDVLIIGAARSGSSSMYKYLAAHPKVVPSIRKETDYFSRRYGRGEAWYRAHFPLKARMALNPGLITFEATPSYLFNPLAPMRAATLVGNVRLIALLRNPIDRAYSQYHHAVRLGLEPLSFEEAIDAEPARIAPKFDDLARDPNYSGPLMQAAYVSGGFYAEQLERWLEHFERDRLLVLMSEELYRCPASVYNEITAFLGLSKWHPSGFAIHTDGGAGQYEPMSSRTRQRLAVVYEPHNRRLADLLGSDVTWA